jgi:hypothetical protein
MRGHCRTTWSPADNPQDALHAWTDRSFRKPAGMGWVITEDSTGAGEVLAQDSKSLGAMHTTFDADISAIAGALFWFLQNGWDYRALVIHSDSTSAIARAGHTGAGPGQEYAVRIQRWVSHLGKLRRRTVDID